MLHVGRMNLAIHEALVHISMRTVLQGCAHVPPALGTCSTLWKARHVADASRGMWLMPHAGIQRRDQGEGVLLGR